MELFYIKNKEAKNSTLYVLSINENPVDYVYKAVI